MCELTLATLSFRVSGVVRGCREEIGSPSRLVTGRQAQGSIEWHRRGAGMFPQQRHEDLVVEVDPVECRAEQADLGVRGGRSGRLATCRGRLAAAPPAPAESVVLDHELAAGCVADVHCTLGGRRRGW